MAYEFDTDVKVVVLGGINKETGKPNPTEIEGYYIGSEVRKSKLNDKNQNFYKFRTPDGDRGVYASAGIDQVMKNKIVGLKTILIATGETLDVGRPQPMKLFKCGQDKTDAIDVLSPLPLSSSEAYDNSDEGLFDDSEEGDTVSLDEVVAARPVAPSAPARVTSKTASSVQAMLKNRQARRI